MRKKPQGLNLAWISILALYAASAQAVSRLNVPSLNVASYLFLNFAAGCNLTRVRTNCSDLTIQLARPLENPAVVVLESNSSGFSLQGNKSAINRFVEQNALVFASQLSGPCKITQNDCLENGTALVDSEMVFRAFPYWPLNLSGGDNFMRVADREFTAVITGNMNLGQRLELTADEGIRFLQDNSSEIAVETFGSFDLAAGLFVKEACIRWDLLNIATKQNETGNLCLRNPQFPVERSSLFISPEIIFDFFVVLMSVVVLCNINKLASHCMPDHLAEERLMRRYSLPLVLMVCCAALGLYFKNFAEPLTDALLPGFKF